MKIILTTVRPGREAMSKLSKNIFNMQSSENLEDFLAQELAGLLKVDILSIDRHSSFFSYGLDSSGALALAGLIETRLNIDFDPGKLWEYRTIASLSDYLFSVGLP